MKVGNGRVRLWIQAACFLLAVAFLGPFSDRGNYSRWILQISPFTAVCTIIVKRTLGIGLALGLLISIIAALRQRWFCRYLCPTGFLLEKIGSVGFSKSSWWKRWPNIGKYCALVTILGAIGGWPFLLWMDPLAIFSSATALFFEKSLLSALLLGIMPILLIAISLCAGSLWCGHLCPLGGGQDLLFSIKSVIKEIKGKISKTDAKSPRNIQPFRRAFLLSVVAVGAALWSKRINAFAKNIFPLRPPGAIDHRDFAGLCIRCGSCMRCCPSKIIHPDKGDAGLTKLLAPVLKFHNDYCRETCTLCMQGCPTGALSALDISSKKYYKIGEAFVEPSRCLLVLGEKDCNVCERCCPFKAVQIHWDEDLYLAYPLVELGKCNGCGACEAFCPTGDIKAIRVLSTKI
jgi:ferredoxin